jgi:hypothetical protein
LKGQPRCPNLLRAKFEAEDLKRELKGILGILTLPSMGILSGDLEDLKRELKVGPTQMRQGFTCGFRGSQKRIEGIMCTP